MSKKNKPNPQANDLAHASPRQMLEAATANVARDPVILQTTTQVQSSTLHQGPMPPPELMAQYEQLVPGTAAKIISMAEQEGQHRRQMESGLLSAQINDAKRMRLAENIGQFCALIIGLAALGSATYLGVHGAQWSASILGGGGITALVTAFIVGRHRIDRERQRRADEATKAKHGSSVNLATVPTKTM